MRIVHLQTTRLTSGRVAIQPSGQLGTCGWHPAAWTVVYVSAHVARSHDKIRAAWNAVNPNLRAVSVDAPAIVEVQS